MMYQMLGPDIKLILIVRDPVERLHSDYNWLRRHSMNRINYLGRFNNLIEAEKSLEECVFYTGTKIVRNLPLSGV